MTVSAGDNGSAGCDDFNTEIQASGGLAVNGLASTPFNIAVGGTDFDVLYSGTFPASFTAYVDVTNSLPYHRSALKYIPEKPWNDSTFQNHNTTISENYPWSVTQDASLANIVAGSGGVSSCVQMSGTNCTAGYPQPTWQSGFASTGTGRNLPDVSLVAGNGLYGAVWGLCTDQDFNPTTGSPIVNCAGTPATGNGFNLTGVGGTSASAPAFAGMLALVKQQVGTRLGQADYVLYNLAKSHYSTVFHDVSSGNNSVTCVPASPGCANNSLNYPFMTGYDAGPGYDDASGLGSVDATQLVNNWSSAGRAATTAALTLNGSNGALNITHGANVDVSVAVTSGAASPGGAVALVDSLSPAVVPNSGGIATFPLANGSASGTTNRLPGGTYTVSSHYSGSDTFASSDSNSISVTVTPESSSTDLKVRSYYNPETGKAASAPYYGYIYAIDAQPYGNSATAANPDGAATGTVTFKVGSATLGTATLASNGVAELLTGSLPTGPDSLTASFAGDGSFQANTSAPLAFTVQPAPTSVELTLGPSNYNVGDTVPITVTFNDGAGKNFLQSVGAAPSGTVTIMDGSNVLGTAPVTGTAGTSTSLATGAAIFNATNLAWGTHTFSATYNGDNNYAPSSESNIVFAYVQGATVNMALTPASNPIKVNQSLLVTVSEPASGKLPTPTGTVKVTVYTPDTYPHYQSPDLALVNGSASVTIPANTLPLGPLILAAQYNGDAVYVGNGTSVPLQVNSSGTITPTVQLTLPSGTVNVPVPVKITVTGPTGDPVPTGPVIVSGTLLTWTLANGTVTFDYPGNLYAGPNTITVNYLGDSNYTGGSATGTVQLMGYSNITFNPNNPVLPINQPLNLSVSVSQVTPLPVPTGTITLSSGSYTSQAVQVASGSANFTIPGNSLAMGTTAITASYSGDTNYVPTTSSMNALIEPAANPAFGLSGTNPTFVAGATIGNTSTVSVTPSGGFTGNVNLTASLTTTPSGAMNLPTLSFGSTSPVYISTPGSGNAVLTISTTARTSSRLERRELPNSPWLPAGAVLACLVTGGIERRRRDWRSALGLTILFFLMGSFVSCGGGGGGTGSGGGGGGNPGTTTGQYVVTITGTANTVSGTLNATATVNFAVN